VGQALLDVRHTGDDPFAAIVRCNKVYLERAVQALHIASFDGIKLGNYYNLTLEFVGRYTTSNGFVFGLFSLRLRLLDGLFLGHLEIFASCSLFS